MVEIQFPVVPEANENYLTEKPDSRLSIPPPRFHRVTSSRGQESLTVGWVLRNIVKRTVYRCGKFDQFI